MLSSTGVKSCTSASGSQLLGNTKKDTIRQTLSSTQKNKVETHPRKVKSSLKNKDYACNGCMLSDNHDLCVLDFINNASARKKSKSINQKFKEKGNQQGKIGNVMISRVYYVEGLGHNLFSVGQFCDSNLEVAFPQHSCFICNLEGVDLLTRSQGNNLYTLSLRDMMTSSPISRHGLVQGLPKLKFEEYHLCSACAMGKSKKKPYKPKTEDTNQETLYLLHMDLCRPMCVTSVNGKKYILFIVDDYS
ncbi:hypothetical protein Tco_1320988 [Tanacetum coccineum]